MADAAAPFTKLTDTPLADVAQLGELGEDARGLLPGATAPEGFVDSLIQAGLFDDAERYLANAMRPREGVWWACLAARAFAEFGGQLSPADQAALAAAEAWVFKPDEDNRRAAHERAMATQFSNPAAWAAMAAFWSGGSMAPPNLPAVPPPPNAFGRAVWGAVAIAVGMNAKSPADLEARHRRFLAEGFDIARGGNGRVEPG